MKGHHMRSKAFYKRKLLIAEREAALAYDPKLGKTPDKLLAHKHKVSIIRVGKIRRSVGVPRFKENENRGLC